METTAIPSMAPWVGVIGSCLGWIFFLFALGMIKSFISHGVSIAIADFLLKNSGDETREKMIRWLGNKDEILAEIKRIRELQEK